MAYEIFNTSRALINQLSTFTRARRMKAFCERMRPRPGLRIVDLGGTPGLWQLIPERLHITIVNLPGARGMKVASHHALTFVEGDACSLPQFADHSFDLVFSNSVIEHVGDDARQAAFAREVRRLGASYWVQTPSPWFPIEAHTGMPLWWFYPAPLRERFLQRWHKTLPSWSDSMAATRVLTRKRVRQLFPDAKLYVEQLAGVPKSYAAYT